MLDDLPTQREDGTREGSLPEMPTPESDLEDDKDLPSKDNNEPEAFGEENN